MEPWILELFCDGYAQVLKGQSSVLRSRWHTMVPASFQKGNILLVNHPHDSLERERLMRHPRRPMQMFPCAWLPPECISWHIIDCSQETIAGRIAPPMQARASMSRMVPRARVGLLFGGAKMATTII